MLVDVRLLLLVSLLVAVAILCRRFPQWTAPIATAVAVAVLAYALMHMDPATTLVQLDHPAVKPSKTTPSVQPST